jgi:type II secretory pathway component PulC
MVGLRPGDIILAVNGTRIETTDDLDRAASAQARQWSVTISRNGQQRTVTLRG